MLSGKRDEDASKVYAIDSLKSEGPFSCFGCKQVLVLKKGNIKVHHFAHKPPHSCSRGAGETEEHRKCKLSIYKELLSRENVTNVELEYDLGSAIADIYAVIDGVRVAIEVQRSLLTVNEIVRRTNEYTRLKVSVLWIALPSSKLMENKYSPSAWERWCHAAYFGRVYYWKQGLKLTPFHFGKYMLDVPISNYFGPGGEEISHGGYEKVSKRYKTPQQGAELDIANHFTYRMVGPFIGGDIAVPQCRLYLDVRKAWWKK